MADHQAGTAHPADVARQADVAHPAESALTADLARRLADRLPRWRGGARVGEVRPLTGGTSSLTFLVDVAGVPAAESPIVVKLAPPGLAPVRNRDVLRQARVQAALQGGRRQLAPDVLFSDPGAPPGIPPYMAMNLVPGECVEPVLRSVADRPTPELVRTRFLGAAGVLADLHDVTPAAVGLADEPVVDLAAEIGRWRRAFETLPDGMRGDYERAAGALVSTIPVALPAVINHGDYRLGNTLCDGARLAAVIDWEIWTVGDPRVDLAWLTFFTDDAGHPAAEPGPPAGTPTPDEVIRAYERRRGVPIADLDWFHALTRYKEAAATGLLLKRAAKSGREVNGTLARMVTALPGLVQETLKIVGD
ncbi:MULTISPECIES: phosphotransferase family protein [unclassified Parafrankia]|uniref:phosphotransferase family protein n=1 Tax=unclassified Parafrankia TaxID=2994368 RepID=UPI000DA5C4CF|nr:MULTISPECIES: phosphotransferase family protein [unclassified Parafrankia]TCJ40042.1 phosphotransferase family protein [Parafrankia sp. BMG5.11]SQD95987.1 Aminoglycoside phosphotransferase [Parafrankia sp. Ea1.12]